MKTYKKLVTVTTDFDFRFQSSQLHNTEATQHSFRSHLIKALIATA